MDKYINKEDKKSVPQGPTHQNHDEDVIDNNFYTHTTESDDIGSFHGDPSFPLAA
jgi:hypothetical protein